MWFGNGFLLVPFDAGFTCETWPSGDRRSDLVNQIVRVLDAVVCGNGEQISAREVVTFAVDAHLVTVGPKLPVGLKDQIMSKAGVSRSLFREERYLPIRCLVTSMSGCSKALT